MRLGFVDHWFVEILGSHNAFKDTGDSPVASSSGGARGNKREPTSQSPSGDSSLSSPTSEDAQQRSSPMPEVAALLRQNGASAAAAAALCEQYRSSPPVLYLSTASPLNIPVFPEPFSISAQHRHRQAVAAATAGAVLHSQPQLSSLDLSCKSEADVAGTSSSTVPTEDGDSPIALTSKASSLDRPAKNGHVASSSSYNGDPSWPERNELLKSYLNAGPKNGASTANSDGASDMSKSSSECHETSKKYWTYQFSTPELSPSPSPQNGAEGKAAMEEEDDDEDGLIIDDRRGSGEEEGPEEAMDEEDDDKVAKCWGKGRISHEYSQCYPPLVRLSLFGGACWASMCMAHLVKVPSF